MNSERKQLSLFDSIPDPDPIPTPKPAMAGIFAVGDRVEIRADGVFYGRQVDVVGIEGEMITVRGKDWAVTRTYHLKALKLCK